MLIAIQISFQMYKMRYQNIVDIYNIRDSCINYISIICVGKWILNLRISKILEFSKSIYSSPEYSLKIL